MGNASLLLAITLGLLAILAMITARTYSRKRKDRAERPKFRMLEDD